MVYVAFILCVGGIVALVWGVMQKFKAGRLAKAPFVPTGDAASKNTGVADPKGAISVQGTVQAQQPLVSPVTGTPLPDPVQHLLVARVRIQAIHSSRVL